MFLWDPDHGMYILFPRIGILCFYGIPIMYQSEGIVHICTIPSDWYFIFLWDPDHVIYVLLPLIGISYFYGILNM
jgi:hypothetical protein